MSSQIRAQDLPASQMVAGRGHDTTLDANRFGFGENDFCRARGFALERLRCSSGSLGCNEFVFRKVDSGS